MRLALLLCYAWSGEATDSRNKIFSLPGIAKERGDEGLRPDYNKSLPQIYTEITRFQIQKDQRLEVLSAVTKTHSSDLPSWVPDWRAPFYISNWGRIFPLMWELLSPSFCNKFTLEKLLYLHISRNQHSFPQPGSKYYI